MVTYYTGSAREKRRYFGLRKIDAALADNSDILADFKLDDREYFVLGDVPFSDMRVGEYIGYARALKTRLPLGDSAVSALLKKVGLRLKPSKSMRRLPRLEFRLVKLAAALCDGTKEVWLNLDGIKYSLFTCIKLRGIVKRIAERYDAHVAVSDFRFVPRKALVKTVENGIARFGHAKRKSLCIGRLRFSRDKRKASPTLTVLNGRKTVVCESM